LVQNTNHSKNESFGQEGFIIKEIRRVSDSDPSNIYAVTLAQAGRDVVKSNEFTIGIDVTSKWGGSDSRMARWLFKRDVRETLDKQYDAFQNIEIGYPKKQGNAENKEPFLQVLASGTAAFISGVYLFDMAGGLNGSVFGKAVSDAWVALGSNPVATAATLVTLIGSTATCIYYYSKCDHTSYGDL
jgi:hypothetical protein